MCSDFELTCSWPLLQQCSSVPSANSKPQQLKTILKPLPSSSLSKATRSAAAASVDAASAPGCCGCVLRSLRQVLRDVCTCAVGAEGQSTWLCSHQTVCAGQQLTCQKSRLAVIRDYAKRSISTPAVLLLTQQQRDTDGNLAKPRYGC
jgi:hypothetical protein